MATLKIGTTIPNFSFVSTGQLPQDFKSLRGHNIVLYFYPKDNTPGCTNEAIDFSKHHKHFEQFNTLILGVSRDSLASHQKFKCKHELNIDLISDNNEYICQLFNVIKEKNMYGKKVMGIERSTFLIDANGILRQEWRKVKVDGHVAEVLAAIKKLELV